MSAKSNLIIFVISLVIYFLIIGPFARFMEAKPTVEKLGYTPRGEFIKYVSVDHSQLIGASLLFKVLFYFGSLVDNSTKKILVVPDYPAMSRAIHAAVHVDPYNMDAYYFGQAILVWDVGKVDLANELLEYGMKYRTWDWYLPFFTGFNYAYFKRDYVNASMYYKKAGELSGAPLQISLATRYMLESGQTDHAIAYLKAMVRSSTNRAVTEAFNTRLAAYIQLQRIERAQNAYRSKNGRLPNTVDELVTAGFLAEIPIDPYGGKFFIDPQGRVRSTSNFAPVTSRKD